MSNISLTPGDWTKLRQIIARIITGRFMAGGIKKGTSQQDAGALKDELWVDTNDNNTVKVGV